jgi:hypothetical protein
MGSHIWRIILKNGGILEVIADRCSVEEGGARFYRNDKQSTEFCWDDHLVGFIPFDRIFSIVIADEGEVFQEVELAR